ADDCRRFGGRQRITGDLRQCELPVVHVVRRTEPVPIGVYAVVSDDDDSSQGRRPRVTRSSSAIAGATTRADAAAERLAVQRSNHMRVATTTSVTANTRRNTRSEIACAHRPPANTPTAKPARQQRGDAEIDMALTVVLQETKETNRQQQSRQARNDTRRQPDQNRNNCHHACPLAGRSVGDPYERGVNEWVMRSKASLGNATPGSVT